MMKFKNWLRHKNTKGRQQNLYCQTDFSKFYGKNRCHISWLLFHLIGKYYVLYEDFDLKSRIVAFVTRFTHEERPKNNFSRQHFTVENNWFII